MKVLELHQMEQIEGGSCGSALNSLGWSAAGLLAAELAIAATLGPIGLLAGIGYAIAWGAAAAAATEVAYNC